jgi:ELWxxDGT repeat protein
MSTGFALSPVMVKDFDPTRQTSWSISWLTGFKGALFFGANDGTTNGIWKSDGTEAGTVLVKALGNPGDPADLKEFVVVGSTLFFQANDGTHGYELWKTDGTDAGTVMVKDILPGSGNSIIKMGPAYKGNVYFNATDGTTHGYELWKSDGTDTGTVMVKDINAGAAHGNPTNLTVSNGTLFFTAITAANGSELWKSDGTDTGTVLVKDINTNTAVNQGNSGTTRFFDLNGTLFFVVTYSVIANTTYTGFQLWKSDGSAAGTVMVKGNIYSGAPDGLTNVNGTLFFSALTGTNGIEIWKSDGTTDGTVLVKDNLAASSNPSFLTNVDGKLFYSAYSDATIGTELWKSDGTVDGTLMVKDIRPTAGGSSAPTYLFNVDGTLFFTANEGTTNGIWKSDGTDAGTTLVLAANSTQTFTNVNGTWFFIGFGSTYGTALWKLGEAPTAISPLTRTQSALTLRLTRNSLIATIPNSMRAQKSSAAIYSLSGNKLFEVEDRAANPELICSIGGLGRGLYLFEVKGSGKRMSRIFSVSR